MSETLQCETSYEISSWKGFFQKDIWSISLFITAFIEICMFRYEKYHKKKIIYKVHASFNNLQ